MKYRDGTKMCVGDRVRIKNGDVGVIVASMDTGEYSLGYPREKWDDLKTGILVLTENGALVRFDEPFPQDLVSRG